MPTNNKKLDDQAALSAAAIAAGAGRGEPPGRSTSLVEPIYQTSVFEFPDVATADAVQDGLQPGYAYARYGLPNTRSLERTLADLEGADDALACSAGMSALLVTFLGLLRAGDHVVAPRDAYGGTYALLTADLSRFGVTTTFVDTTDAQVVHAAVRLETRLILGEIIANPTMSVCDIAALAQIAQQQKAILVIDNTFATPVLCHPLTFGADLIIHSASKFLGGHNDVISGIVAGKQDYVDAIRATAIRTGCVLSPFDAWLTLRGIKTLPVRMRQSCQNALTVARYLESHPLVTRVCYPGLPGHPQHAVATRQLTGGYGAMLAFDVAGGLDKADIVLQKLRLLAFAPSLGGVNSTVSHPVSTSHRKVPPVERENAGITDGMIRVSIGIEEAADIIADLDQALAATRS